VQQAVAQFKIAEKQNIIIINKIYIIN